MVFLKADLLAFSQSSRCCTGRAMAAPPGVASPRRVYSGHLRLKTLSIELG
jgi:hypothetical protein